MKTVTVVLIFVWVIYTQQQTTLDPVWQAAWLENRTACAKENGVEVADALKIWTDPNFPANNQPLKCYYKCMTVKMGIIDNGNTYDNSDTMNFFAHLDNTAQLKEIHDECKDTPPNSDECEFAYQIFKCIAEAQLD